MSTLGARLMEQVRSAGAMGATRLGLGTVSRASRARKKLDSALAGLDSGAVQRILEQHPEIQGPSLPIGQAILNARRHAPEKGMDALATVQALLAAGADPNGPVGLPDLSPLGRCLDVAQNGFWSEEVRAAHRAMAALLVQQGADFGVPDAKGRWPLHWAAALGDAQFFDLLVSRGADLSALDREGCSALFLAAAHDHPDVALRALASHNNVAKTSFYGETALHRSAVNADAALCEVFLDHGALVNAQNDAGNAALHRAAVAGALEACLVLLGQGADLALANEDQHTPLHLAAKSGQGDVCALLIERGAPVHALDSEGRTPKGLARDEGHAHIAPLIDACWSAAQARQAVETMIAGAARGLRP